MIKRLLVTIVFLLGAGLVTGADARDRWRLMGEEEIALSETSADIVLTQARGAYKALRVRARRGGVVLTSVRVFYGDGTRHDEDRQIKLNSGERSKPIDAGEEGRFVDRVDLTYKSDPDARRPVRVQVWGLQDSKGRRAKREKREIKAADAPGEVLFGYKKVGFGVDTDTIRVGSETGKFARVRLRVLKNDVFVKSVKVVYQGGKAEEFAIDDRIPKGARTRWFDVEPEQFIQDIELVYRSRPNFSGQAIVEVSGQYAPGWLGPEGNARKYNQGWVLLGAQSAGMFGVDSVKSFGFDRDVIPVGVNEGGFKKIRLKVRNRSITLRQLRIVYYEGDDTVIKRRARVDPGQTEGPWDVKPGAPIKQIVASYRGRIVWGKGKGVPVVEIWGKH